MPKRVLRQHLEKTAKCQRKSMINNDPSLSANQDVENEDCRNEPMLKHMQYLKLNHNNEVERLLLHNSKTLLYHVDHCDFPAFNVGMWPQESNTLTMYPSCAFSVPRPIFVANKQCEKVDICYKRPMNADFHKKRMRHTRTSYKTVLKNNKAIRSSIKDDIYHSSIYDMAERIYMEPDPFFHSSYDYYFTGGNLSVSTHNKHLIHAKGEQLQEIAVSKYPIVQDSGDTNYLQTIASHKISEDSEIFEVLPLRTSVNSSRQNGFIVRQRNLITFNYLNDEKQIKTVTQFRTKSTPFISFAQSERNINTFIITTMKQHVRLYDLNCTPALEKLFEISPKTKNISWNIVKPWRENTFLYANEKQFFLIDVRTTPEQWLSEVTSATDSLNCDHISSVLPSNFNNLFYVATDHKLQCMDIRHLKKFSFSDTEGAVCRWTHQLRYAPLMMDTIRLHQTEYIALSSPLAGDLHICQLSRERNKQDISLEPSQRMQKHIYSSSCLPYQPPTLFEAYEYARLSGKCLSPETNLEARLKCCTTGMKFINSSLDNSETSIGLLLTSNSNGDVFSQTLSKREKVNTEERCNRHSDEIMAEFEKKICEQNQQPLYYTDIKNMRGLRKVFLCMALSDVKKIDFDAMDNEYDKDDNVPAINDNNNPPTQPRPKRPHLGRWQKPLSTLHSYKDALVADLLSIWDIDIEEERHIRLGNLRTNIKPDPTLKVKNWLDKNINPIPPPMLTIPAKQISRYGKSNTSLLLDNNTTIITQTQSTEIDFENAVHSTQIMENNINISKILETTAVDTTTAVTEKLKNKKKNKYVKGF